MACQGRPTLHRGHFTRVVLGKVEGATEVVTEDLLSELCGPLFLFQPGDGGSSRLSVLQWTCDVLGSSGLSPFPTPSVSRPVQYLGPKVSPQTPTSVDIPSLRHDMIKTLELGYVICWTR